MITNNPIPNKPFFEDTAVQRTPTPQTVFGGSSGSGGEACPPPTVAGWHATLYPDTGISTVSVEKLHRPSLTGHGEITNIECGHVRTLAVCSNHPEKHRTRAIAARTCRDLHCPTCWTYRAAELAETCSDRLWGYWQATRKHKPRHATFSVPPQKVRDFAVLPDEERDKALREWGQKMAKLAGFTAGTPIVHQFRIKPQYRDQMQDKARAINYEIDGSQQQRHHENRYTVIPKENWQHYVDFSPHVHVIGYGFLKNTEDFYNETGVVYRMHKGGKQMQTKDDVKRAIYYLLSHASPIEGRHIITYFGGVSYNKMICVEETKREVVERCPDCGAPRIYQDTGQYVTRTVYDRVYLIKSTGQRSQTTSIRGQDSLFLYIDCEPEGGEK